MNQPEPDTTHTTATTPATATAATAGTAATVATKVEPTVRLQEGLRSAVVIVSGKDQKGVSAEFFRVLAHYGVQLLDVQQSEFLGHLQLAAFTGIKDEYFAELSEALTDALTPLGQQVTIEYSATNEGTPAPAPRSTHVVVVLGNPVTAQAISAIGATLAKHGACAASPIIQ